MRTTDTFMFGKPYHWVEDRTGAPVLLCPGRTEDCPDHRGGAE